MMHCPRPREKQLSTIASYDTIVEVVHFPAPAREARAGVAHTHNQIRNHRIFLIRHSPWRRPRRTRRSTPTTIRRSAPFPPRVPASPPRSAISDPFSRSNPTAPQNRSYCDWRSHIKFRNRSIILFPRGVICHAFPVAWQRSETRP
jgi:hypothetical protein